MYYQDVIGELVYGGEVVIDEYQCGVCICDFVQQFQDLCLYGCIECGCGFICYEYGGVGGECGCDQCLLVQVVGEFVWMLLCVMRWVGYLYLFQEFMDVCVLSCFFLGDFVQLQWFCDFGVDLMQWIERDQGVLGYEFDLCFVEFVLGMFGQCYCIFFVDDELFDGDVGVCWCQFEQCFGCE